jgi:isocitrate dehydrogenase kinase/phosphatase
MPLIMNDVDCLLLPNLLYADIASGRGLFTYDEDRWYEEHQYDTEYEYRTEMTVAQLIELHSKEEDISINLWFSSEPDDMGAELLPTGEWLVSRDC